MEGEQTVTSQDHCAHDGVDEISINSVRRQTCKEFGMNFYYCNECSEYGSVYHGLPLCRTEAEKEGLTP